MFSIQHFIWLIICITLIVLFIRYRDKNNLDLNKVLDYASIICICSEFIKVFSVIEMVPSSDGSIIRPYLPMNHLPLHLCSIQIPFIFLVRHTANKELRETILMVMYPSALMGAIAALIMPSIFSTSISVNQAFTHPMAYQFFVFHSMLIALGLCIAKSDEVDWSVQTYFKTIKIFFVIAFLSLYINSMFASPTYVDGKLVSVDFWPNFFFSYNNPLNIPMTKITHWYLYLVILVVLVMLLTWISYYPLIRKNKKKNG